MNDEESTIDLGISDDHYDDFTKDIANATRISCNAINTIICNTCGLLKYKYCAGHFGIRTNYDQ